MLENKKILGYSYCVKIVNFTISQKLPAFNRTKCEFCPVWYGQGGWRLTLKEYCGQLRDTTLLAEWDPARNGGLTPSDVSSGSNRKVWWLCSHGHSWQAQVNSRVSGCGCPVCANRVVLPGVNDLASAYPDLAAQWHPLKNGTLAPTQVSPGSRRKVWWRCEHGHEWQARISARTGTGCGCPVCTGKAVLPGENDLSSQFPEIALEWDPKQNGPLCPDSISAYSNRRVWWRCTRGHTWRATVSSRTINRTGCPYCTGTKVLAGFNDLETLEPKIAAQWDQPLNGTLLPRMVTRGSRKKVWWRCPEGHVWQAAIYSRTGPQQRGCPVCAGTVRQTKVPRPVPRAVTNPPVSDQRIP